jgi:hypothetical protein
MSAEHIKKQYPILPWFQAVPYPFSSVFMFAAPKEYNAGKELQLLFLKHLVLALAYLARNKEEATEVLINHSPEFRNYGLRTLPMDRGEREAMVGNAFATMMRSDIFSETVEDTWVAWDLALKALDSTEAKKMEPAVLEYLEAPEVRTLLAKSGWDRFGTDDFFDKQLTEMTEKIALELQD